MVAQRCRGVIHRAPRAAPAAWMMSEGTQERHSQGEHGAYHSTRLLPVLNSRRNLPQSALDRGKFLLEFKSKAFSKINRQFPIFHTTIPINNRTFSKSARSKCRPLSSKLVPQNSKMRRRGSRKSPRPGGSIVGRSWVARGSVGRSRVADFSSRSGNTRVVGPPVFEYIQL